MFCYKHGLHYHDKVYLLVHRANLQRQDKENGFKFLPSERVCLLEQIIYSCYPGTFDLGLHGKFEDESPTFGWEELMMEQPEVVMGSEVKSAAESVNQALRS